MTRHFFIFPPPPHPYAPRVTPEARPTSLTPSRQELAGVFSILLVFLLVNALVGTLTPTVYMDEPEHTDPAANLYFGHGFTSTAWAQPHTAFWSGYVPLYSGILWLWFKLAGFGFFQARFINTLLAAFGGLLIWSAVRRNGLIRESSSRLLCLALVLSGSVSTLTFRTIRPDTAMFALCALVFFLCSLTSLGVTRYLVVALTCLLLPFAGLPILPYIALLLVLIVLFYGFGNLRAMLAIGCGLAVGIGALLLFYRQFLALDSFLHFLLPSTILNSAAPGTSSLHNKIFGESLGSANLFTSFFGNPLEFRSQANLFDYSAALLFAALIVLSLSAWPAVARARQFALFMLAVTLLVPPGIYFAGHFPSYYRWMTYIPLAIAVPRLLEIHRAATLRTSGQRGDGGESEKQQRGRQCFYEA